MEETRLLKLKSVGRSVKAQSTPEHPWEILRERTTSFPRAVWRARPTRPSHPSQDILHAFFREEQYVQQHGSGAQPWERTRLVLLPSHGARRTCRWALYPRWSRIGWCWTPSSPRFARILGLFARCVPVKLTPLTPVDARSCHRRLHTHSPAHAMRWAPAPSAHGDGGRKPSSLVPLIDATPLPCRAAAHTQVRRVLEPATGAAQESAGAEGEPAQRVRT